jgi:hypothetical protein
MVPAEDCLFWSGSWLLGGLPVPNPTPNQQPVPHSSPPCKTPGQRRYEPLEVGPREGVRRMGRPTMDGEEEERHTSCEHAHGCDLCVISLATWTACLPAALLGPEGQHTSPPLPSPSHLQNSTLPQSVCPPASRWSREPVARTSSSHVACTLPTMLVQLLRAKKGHLIG